MDGGKKHVINIDDWDCAKHVPLEYFCKERGCSKNCLNSKIAEVMRDYPGHFFYVGITHDPCYRYTGNPSQTSLLEAYGIHIPSAADDIVLNEGMLTERAHKYDFERMFVICYCDNEQDIRDRERAGISIAHDNDILQKWVTNKYAGGNGPLKPNQSYYFLYICISETKPTFGQE